MVSPALTSLRDQRDALQGAIRSGAASITVDNETVSYRSGADMRAALSELLRTIADAETQPQTRPRVSTFNTSGGV
jgi:hypothetical protein